MKVVKIIGVMLAIPLFVLLGVYTYYHLPCDQQSREIRVVVERGESLGRISKELADSGLVRFPELFTGVVRLLGRDRSIHAGEYTLDSSMSPKQILERLCRGMVSLSKITLPEGLTARRIAELLEQKGLAKSPEIQELTHDPDFLKELKFEGDSLEGFLFPDTYHFAEGVPAREILEAMVRRFWAVYDSDLRAKQAILGWSVRDVVTLASIIEKETGHRDEMPLIASVLNNRLEKRMPLQCDPTVIYGITAFDGNLTRKHLRTPGPYNTYLNRGLPPGPICNPGLDSLQAVLDPAETPFLYFVSKNDGTHHFSATIGEHNRAVRKYQQKGRH